MTYIFVVNGREDKKAIISEDLKQQLEGIELKYELYYTKGVGDGIRYVRIYCDLHRDEEVFFIACGGSGTLNEVASGVVGFKKKRIGFLPYGQTNDFIKYYPDYDFRSLKKLLAGETAQVDIIRANNWYSLNLINIGFDSYVSYEGNQLMDNGVPYKKAYDLAVLKCILTKRRNRIQVIADGEVLNRRSLLLCPVANAQWCGGTYHCSPRAVVDDGLIDVCLVKPCSFIGFLIIFKHFVKGDHLENKFCMRKIEYRRARHVDVKSKDILFISPDGEVCADIEFSIDILPKEITFVLPQKD